VKVSKRAVAREWLIFLVCLCLSFGALLVFVRQLPREVVNFLDSLGLGGVALILLFPYLILALLRSIFWSIKTLVAPRSQSEHS
jgi:hypothetical protein